MELSSDWMETSVSILADARAGKLLRRSQTATRQSRAKNNEEPLAHAVHAPTHIRAGWCRPSITLCTAFGVLVSTKAVFTKTSSSKVRRQVMQFTFAENTIVATVNTENKASSDGIDEW